MEIILVEDEGWRALRPLTWLRPAGHLLVGGHSNSERWQDVAGGSPGVLCRPEIARCIPDALGEIPTGRRRRLWVRDRLVPDASWAGGATAGERATAWTNGGMVLAVRTDRLPPADAEPGSDRFWEALANDATPAALDSASLLTELSDLVPMGAARLVADLEKTLAAEGGATDFGDGAAYAPERIHVGDGCRIDRGAVLDARDGPISLGKNTLVFPHTWIRGPFGCRDNCMLLGGRVGGGSYFGPHCRVRGEVEATTFLGYVNKAHDGFVGHSYLAEWVNLGALTTTSDLKNNYGVVRLDAYGRTIDTAQQKIGSFLGDHAKTRIGAMLNSGSVIGVAANLFGEASVFPKWIPDFIWGVGEQASEYAWNRCLRTVETVLSRRGRTCSDELRDALRVAYSESRSERERFLGR
jgi:UDP-N-acetylglucosamine diphosphorylase/glucosamine-1-phosphate N-acetyltransferase